MADPAVALYLQAQQGKAQIKNAIVSLLQLRRGCRLKRGEIERHLGLASIYLGRGYVGELASMLLNELAETDKLIQRHQAGERGE
jgi:hypothetical protein